MLLGIVASCDRIAADDAKCGMTLGKVGLMLNVHRDHLQAVLGVLPALKRPTISQLSDQEWLAVNTILDESTVRDIIPRLKQAGAQGIVEYPLNKIVM